MIAGQVEPDRSTVQRVGNRGGDRGRYPRHGDSSVASGIQEAFESGGARVGVVGPVCWEADLGFPCTVGRLVLPGITSAVYSLLGAIVCWCAPSQRKLHTNNIKQAFKLSPHKASFHVVTFHACSEPQSLGGGSRKSNGCSFVDVDLSLPCPPSAQLCRGNRCVHREHECFHIRYSIQSIASNLRANSASKRRSRGPRNFELPANDIRGAVNAQIYGVDICCCEVYRCPFVINTRVTG